MREVLIDTDTGSDDAVALVMAARHSSWDVKAITTVCGNVAMKQGQQNALYTLELCNNEVPVYKGAAKPLLRELITATFVHGEDGLGDIGLPLHGRLGKEENAIDIIKNQIIESNGNLEIITLGPLTNMAIALLKDPTLAQKVKCCYIMGGTGDGKGNVTPVSEYNIWADPEAAKIVLASGMKIKMIGWDISVKYASFTLAELQNLRNLNTPLSKFCVDIQKTKLIFSKERSGKEGLDLPDPVAMAVAMDETIVTDTYSAYVDIKCHDDDTRGQTMIYPGGTEAHGPNVEIIRAIDEARFKQMLKKSIS